MSDLRSVLLLCWRDTGHPPGGGARSYRRCPDKPRGRPVFGVRVGALGDGGGSTGDRTIAGGATRRGDRHPKRLALYGPAGYRPAGRGVGKPTPSCAVAGGRPGVGTTWLVRRIVVVAKAAPPQPIRDGVAAVGP